MNASSRQYCIYIILMFKVYLKTLDFHFFTYFLFVYVQKTHFYGMLLPSFQLPVFVSQYVTWSIEEP